MTHSEQAEEERKDFFISYSSADRTWAEWIDWQLTTQGYSTILPDQGLRSGNNIALEIDKIFKKVRQVIAVISPYYLNALYGQLEWAVVMRQKATREHRLFVLIHVRECKRALKSLLGPISFIDLVEQEESVASDSLITSLRENYGSSESNGSVVIPHLHNDKAEQEFIKKQLSFLRRQGMTSEWRDFDMDGVEPAALPLHNLPYQRNPFFTNREEILNRLHDALREGKTTGLSQPLALSGLGGIGKTQIALEYTYRYKDEYHFILWAQADSYGSLVSEFVSIARVLRLPERNIQNHDQVVRAVKRWLQSNPHWLLILDNVDDLVMANDFIPVGSKGDVLLTTCAYAIGTIAQSVVVDKLGLEDGVKLLLNRVKALSEADHDAVETISRAMDGIPLALDQAGAYIEKMRCTLGEYLGSYSRQRTELLKERGEPTFAHPDSVTATWLLSFENISKANPAAADLLHLCAFLAPDAIPEEIITQGVAYLGPILGPVAASPFELDRAIEELRKFSLISRNADKSTLSMHSLVQEVLKGQMAVEERRLFAESAVQAVNHVYPYEEFATWEQCERYSLQAQACADLIEAWQMRFPEAARLLHEAGSYLFERAQYEQAKALYEQALAVRKYILHPDDLHIAASYNDLAWLYRTVGKYEQAETLFNQALAIREKQLGPDDLLVAQTVNHLAWLYYNQGKYNEAEPLYKRAMEIREKVLIADDPEVAASLNNLAWLYYMQGRYEEAESLYLRALAVREQVLPPTHPELATILDNLARLYRTQGKYGQAEAFYRRALDIRRYTLGPEHPEVALSLSGLALLYYAQGRYEQSEFLHRQALAIRKKALGSEHPHVAHTLNNLGRLYRAQGRYKQAEESYLQALTIRERMLGVEHLDVAQTLNNLARLYRAQGKYHEAELLYLRALIIRKQALGAEHPDVAQTLNNQARLYRIQGRYHEAEQLHHVALAIRKKMLGDEHLDVAQTLNNMAKLYRIQGRYAQAELLGKESYAIWEKKLGPEHPYLSLILNNLAEVYQAQHRNSEAEQSYLRALEIQKKTTDLQHSDAALILNHLAEIAMGRGEYERAETFLRQAMAVRQQVLGPEHPHIAHSLDIFSEVHSAQKQYDRAAAFLQQAISIREKALGPDHPDVANSLYNLAELFAAQDRNAEAERLYVQALTIREQSLGAEHLDVAVTLHHLADLYQVQEKYIQAEALYQRALAIYEHVEDPGLDGMLLVMEHFATLLRKMEREVKAMELQARIQKLRNTRVLEIPPSHIEVERDRGSIT